MNKTCVILILKSLFIFIIALVFLSCSSKRELTEVKRTGLVSVETVKIYEEDGVNFGPCEPSIAINRKNPSQIVAGSVLKFVHRSPDGGRTWETKTLESKLGVYGDPCLVADGIGNFYYLHLGDPEGSGWLSDRFLESIVIQKSIDGGKSWSEGSSIGPNPPKQQDKEWVAVNPKNNHLCVTWTEFDKYGSKSDTCFSRILFSQSGDLGSTWTEPFSLSQFEGNCIDDDFTPEGAVPAIGRQGEIFVSWGFDEKIYFDRSFDNGNTWLDEDIVVVEQQAGWAMEIPGLDRCNGMPVTGIDNSNGKYSGSLYIVYADQNKRGTDTDIFLVRSLDQGNTWSEPIHVFEDDRNRHQFLPWMSVDEKTGNIFIVFYDRSAYNDLRTDVMLAVSEDGGQTFSRYTISESPFLPPGPSKFFGDYNNIDAYNGKVRPIWTSYSNNKLSIWTALIDWKSKL